MAAGRAGSEGAMLKKSVADAQNISVSAVFKMDDATCS